MSLIPFRKAVRAPIGLALEWHDRRVRDGLAHELAICAIFKDEGPNLDEWIEFHAGVGATHFYLYNNGSTDNFAAVLAPWIARGFVTLIDWPRYGSQVAAYDDCVRRARATSRWLALIDLDEFLFSPETVDIRPILRSCADLPGIHVWQHLFGSGGHEHRPALPVTEAYRLRAPVETQTMCKTIVNPRRVYKSEVHICKYWRGESLDLGGQRAGPPARPVLEPLRINHYWSRSLEDFRAKLARGNSIGAPQPPPEGMFAKERRMNAIRDEAILPIARAIRSAHSADRAIEPA